MIIKEIDVLFFIITVREIYFYLFIFAVFPHDKFSFVTLSFSSEIWPDVNRTPRVRCTVPLGSTPADPRGTVNCLFIICVCNECIKETSESDVWFWGLFVGFEKLKLLA